MPGVRFLLVMKPAKFAKFSLKLAISVLLCSSCAWMWNNDFKIETTSPQGTYRLIFEGRKEPPDGYLQSETVRLKVMKGEDVFFTKDPFFKEDSLDPHFRDLFPLLQWFDDSTLRMGEELSQQPFSDEITIYNRADEEFDVVEISYGRDERFLIFDFAPGTKVELKASPHFKSQWGAASHLFYKAHAKGGRILDGGTEGRKRKSPEDGASSYSVEIVESL
jgi:hypothetical protein